MKIIFPSKLNGCWYYWVQAVEGCYIYRFPEREREVVIDRLRDKRSDQAMRAGQREISLCKIGSGILIGWYVLQDEKRHILLHALFKLN